MRDDIINTILRPSYSDNDAISVVRSLIDRKISLPKDIVFRICNVQSIYHHLPVGNNVIHTNLLSFILEHSEPMDASQYIVCLFRYHCTLGNDDLVRQKRTEMIIY